LAGDRALFKKNYKKQKRTPFVVFFLHSIIQVETRLVRFSVFSFSLATQAIEQRLTAAKQINVLYSSCLKPGGFFKATEPEE